MIPNTQRLECLKRLRALMVRICAALQIHWTAINRCVEVKDKRWLDTHKWGVRAFDSGMKANYNGFQFQRGWNTCPDWDDKPECGGGFHLMTAEHNGFGFGFCGSLIRFVEYSGRIVELGDKIKVEKLRIVPCSYAVLEAALVRCGIQVPKDGETVAHGIAVVLNGRPRITQSGGVLCTYGRSKLRITQSGGTLFAYAQSQPRITRRSP